MAGAFSKILILVIIAVLVAGGFFAWQYFRSPKEEVNTPEDKVVADETADWQTYRNEEYGFEIKYPAIAEKENLNFTFQLPSTRLLTLKIAGKNLDDCLYSPLGQSIQKNKVEINGREFCLNVDLDSGSSTKIKYYNYVTKSKKENEYIIFEFMAEYNPYCGVYSEYQCEKFNEDEAINLFSQMLSTFKFLK